MSNEDFICEEGFEDEEREDSPPDSPSSSRPSTPTSRGRKKKSTGSEKVATTIRCHLCPRYTCKKLDTYYRHLKLHVAEDLYKSAPSIDVAVERFRPEAKAILFKMQSTEYSSELRKKCCEIAAQLHEQAQEKSTGFVDLIIMELWACFPPASRIEPKALNSAFVQNVNDLLADLDKRKSFNACLRETIVPLNCEKDGRVIDWFVCDFVRNLAEPVEVFYLRTLTNPREEILVQTLQNNAEDDECSDDDPVESNTEHDKSRGRKFQQTIHYIGGSTVKSAMRLALRSKGNKKWDNIYSCLPKRFLCGNLVDGVEEEVRAWTETRSRGGLTFIIEPCWCFLMALSGICKKEEKSDGSLIHSEVLSIVKDDDIAMFLWSDVIGSELTDEEKDILLEKVCMFFVNTWGRGIALRRKNAIVGRSRDKVPLRSSLLSK